MEMKTTLHPPSEHLYNIEEGAVLCSFVHSIPIAPIAPSIKIHSL